PIAPLFPYTTLFRSQGAHVNISGGGVARNAPNRENAIRLLEFLASAESQQHISRHNNEFPASPDVEAPAPVDAFADFEAHPMHRSEEHTSELQSREN